MRVESATENYWRQFASATYSDSSKLPYIKVVYNEPESISVNPNQISLNVGETFTPEIVISPAGAEGTLGGAVSNTDVITVNNTTGAITALAPGNATIIYSFYTGLKIGRASCRERV